MNVFENGLHFAFSFGAALDGHSSGPSLVATPPALVDFVAVLPSCLWTDL